MIKLTKKQLKLISSANAQVQDLKEQQLKIYEKLLSELPDSSKDSDTKNYIWEYVFNNQSHRLTLDERGLEIRSLFDGF
jgi:hypothetical protein